MVDVNGIELVAQESYKYFCNLRGKFIPAGEIKDKVKKLDSKVLAKIIGQYAEYRGVEYCQQLYLDFPRLEESIEGWQFKSSWLL